MNFILKQAIQIVAGIILGSDVFPRVLSVVETWAEKQINSDQKRDGALSEFKIIGLELTESAARFGVELAVQYLKRVKA